VVDGQAIEHHMWMLQPTVTTYKVQDLTRDQSEALRQRFRFVLLGATATSKIELKLIDLVMNVNLKTKFYFNRIRQAVLQT
jgi:hypothetical protein